MCPCGCAHTCARVQCVLASVSVLGPRSPWPSLVWCCARLRGGVCPQLLCGLLLVPRDPQHLHLHRRLGLRAVVDPAGPDVRLERALRLHHPGHRDHREGAGLWALQGTGGPFSSSEGPALPATCLGSAPDSVLDQTVPNTRFRSCRQEQLWRPSGWRELNGDRGHERTGRPEGEVGPRVWEEGARSRAQPSSSRWAPSPQLLPPPGRVHHVHAALRRPDHLSHPGPDAEGSHQRHRLPLHAQRESRLPAHPWAPRPCWSLDTGRACEGSVCQPACGSGQRALGSFSLRPLLGGLSCP